MTKQETIQAMMDGKKMSAFEFAILQVADPEEAKNYQPFTKEEESQMRLDKIMDQSNQMRTIHRNT